MRTGEKESSLGVTELSRTHRSWSRAEGKAWGQEGLGRYLGGATNRASSSAHGVPPEVKGWSSKGRG